MVGGLFDYSVYSWPSINQEWNQVMVGPCEDQVRTMLGPGKDPDLAQELDNSLITYKPSSLIYRTVFRQGQTHLDQGCPNVDKKIFGASVHEKIEI